MIRWLCDTTHVDIPSSSSIVGKQHQGRKEAKRSRQIFIMEKEQKGSEQGKPGAIVERHLWVWFPKMKGEGDIVNRDIATINITAIKVEQ